MEKKVEEQEETIQQLTNKLENVHKVVDQLLGGLFCHTSQRHTLNYHLDILFNEEPPEKIAEDYSKWGHSPTTRQGDENEYRIKNLECDVRYLLEKNKDDSSSEENDFQDGFRIISSSR